MRILIISFGIVEEYFYKMWTQQGLEFLRKRIYLDNNKSEYLKRVIFREQALYQELNDYDEGLENILEGIGQDHKKRMKSTKSSFLGYQ